MAHIVLLGDSIFDNASYVPDGRSVSEHLRHCLPNPDDQVSLLAVDGDYIEDVTQQLKGLPREATHLFISVGGNDALRYGSELLGMNVSLPSALKRLAEMKQEFDQRYQTMLTTVLTLNKPTIICTVYDQCPMTDPVMHLLAFTALGMFNDCITRHAIRLGLPLIDLRIVCSEASDYSPLSPIEPSHSGGEKIARCIAAVLSEHDFSIPHTVCYSASHLS